MATKKKSVGKPAPAAAVAATGKKKMTPAERKEKQEARKAAMAALPEGQRPNSKMVDIIIAENGSKVEVYAQPVRKFGLILTSVAYNSDGEIVGTAITTIAGYRAKSKKGHGTLAIGAPGMGKKSKASDDEDEDEDEEEEAETKPAAKSKGKKAKKATDEDEDEDDED